ncbi:peptidase domain-containing ABC transporter [Myxococcus sp. AB056]|uniref:peptidase domain-containing ABC transporter n=2 Tax=unclassified Myxococcus TaxID=2648731 RepID=UPI0011469AD5|nr:peptidase domain-containing ABC transporter [Myxococcus sp. AB056]
MTAAAPQQPQRRWRLGLRKRVPEVRQMTMTDCGAACLAMVLAYHGRHMGLDAVREVTGPGRDGASAKALKAAAQKLGLRVRAISVDLDRLPFLPPATILHWRFTHYVVFERLGRGWVEVVDPDQGRRRVSMEQFSQCFTGVALLMEPSENFQPGHTRRGPYRYLVPLVKRQAGTLVKVLALSAVLQVLTLAVPLLTGMVVDRVVPRQDYSLMGVLSAALAGVLLFELLTSVVRGQLLVELRTRLDSQMTQGLLDHLVSLAYPFFQLRPAGDLLTRLGSQQAIRELLSTGLLSSALDGALVLLYLGLLLVADASLGLLVVGLGLLQVLVFALPRARQRSHLSRSLDMGVRSQSYLMAMLSGMQTLKAFGVEDRMVGSYANLYVDLLNVELERGRLSAWLDALTGTLRRVSPLVLLCVGAWRVLDGAMSLGQMLSINALATALLVPLSNLLGTGGQLQFLSTYLERINDVLDTPPERDAAHRGRAPTLRGAVTLEDVRFRYNPHSAWVVQGVTVSVEPGQMVALVGRSGAGKSTLAHLLLGLYLPTSGHVRYDGAELGELDLRAVRSQLGVVLQDASFFNASLRENITLSDPDLDMDRVVEAAKLAHIHDDIMAMPMQYDTPLTDRGLSMSGGQRQRLALARALVRRPAILLLDEATSALDATTEAHVQQALASLKCTRVVIAHRLSTVRNADTILVMEAGQVVEVGRHQELLERQGTYASLVNAQREERTQATG